MSEALAGYRSAARQLKHAYDALDPALIYGSVNDVLPKSGDRVLDIGAGTGRDAAWFAHMGCHVTAVEPVTELWAHPEIPMIPDQLPNLVERKLTFDVIIITGVWHHLSPDQRKDAIPVLWSRLKPAGKLLFNLRHGPCAKDRPGFRVSAFEEREVLIRHRFKTVFQRHVPSVQIQNTKNDVTWMWICAQKLAV